MDTQKLGLQNLSPIQGSRHRRKRLGDGQGSGHGQTSTRGQKGQRGRSGDGKLVGFEGGQTPLLRRIPKRGFRNTAFQRKYQVIHLSDLARVFGNQKEVHVDALRMHKLAKGILPIKILGDGDIQHGFNIQAHAFSKSAKEKIAKAGGTAELVPF